MSPNMMDALAPVTQKTKGRVSFADVAHQTLTFDAATPSGRIILELIDTKWVQRLRNIRQTGNTHLVYMFAEHSRFGHSLGVAYLTHEMLSRLAKDFAPQIAPYRTAMAAAALLHDVGHVAPGSHLAERIWSASGTGSHERVGTKIIRHDPEILSVLERFGEGLVETVSQILAQDPLLPPWTRELISGDGWNADRGNWSIVDSTMCAVSYGRYNVFALLDAYKLSPHGHLLLSENRLDALTHFFVARDSMYRQVYQHRVLQVADALSERIVLRLRDILSDEFSSLHSVPATEVISAMNSKRIFCDETMAAALCCNDPADDLSLDSIYEMTESWWRYHLDRWCGADDFILRDLAQRLRDRNLFKTIRLDRHDEKQSDSQIIAEAKHALQSRSLDPRYYLLTISNADRHRARLESPPLVQLDNGSIVSVTDVEPLIHNLLSQSAHTRRWLAVPKEIKAILGRMR